MSEKSANLQGGQNTEENQENKTDYNFRAENINQRDESALFAHVREDMEKQAIEQRQAKQELRSQYKQEKSEAAQRARSEKEAAAKMRAAEKTQIREAQKAVRFTRRRERNAKIKEFIFGGWHKYVFWTVIFLVVAISVKAIMSINFKVAEEKQAEYTSEIAKTSNEYLEMYREFEKTNDAGAMVSKYEEVLKNTTPNQIEYRTAAIQYAKVLQMGGNYKEAVELLKSIEKYAESDSERRWIYIGIYEASRLDDDLSAETESYGKKIQSLNKSINDGDPYEEE